MSNTDTAFLSASAAFLRDTYLPRIERALAVLPDGDLWWRPHTGALAAGNILAHLQGNLRQWIVGALGGEPDARDRDAEFAARGGADASTAFAALADTVRRAAAVIEAFPPARLLEPLTIQGFATTPQWAVYHVVEHFAWHTGQLVAIAKQRAGAAHGVAFYDDAKLSGVRNPPRGSD